MAILPQCPATHPWQRCLPFHPEHQHAGPLERPYGKLLGLGLCGLSAAVVVWCLRALVRLVL